MAEVITKDEVKYEKPRLESTCRVVLESPSPCAFPRILFLICHAWYRLKARPEEKSMRAIFVEGLEEARGIWAEKCELGQHSSNPEAPTEEEFVRMGWVF